MSSEIPLGFTLGRAEACESKGAVFALPYVLKGWQSVGRLNQIYLGNEMPDVKEPHVVLEQVFAGFESQRVPRKIQSGLMAVEVVKLCAVDHKHPRKQVEPVLERAAAYVLGSEGAKPFGVKVAKRADAIDVVYDPPIPGAASIKPAIVLQATRQEINAAPLRHAIESVPFTGGQAIGYTALRGHELIVYPLA